MVGGGRWRSGEEWRIPLTLILEGKPNWGCSSGPGEGREEERKRRKDGPTYILLSEQGLRRSPSSPNQASSITNSLIHQFTNTPIHHHPSDIHYAEEYTIVTSLQHLSHLLHTPIQKLIITLLLYLYDHLLTYLLRNTTHPYISIHRSIIHTSISDPRPNTKVITSYPVRLLKIIIYTTVMCYTVSIRFRLPSYLLAQIQLTN